MGQNIVVFPQANEENKKPVTVRLLLPPISIELILKLSLAFTVVISVGLSLKLPFDKVFPPLQPASCAGTCTAAPRNEELGAFMERCTRKDMLSASRCAEMWETVEGRTNGRRD